MKGSKNKLEDDITEILATQSLQSIKGQALKRVIKLIGDMVEDLVRLVATFRLKMGQGFKAWAINFRKVILGLT